MNELEVISVIKSTLKDSTYIGDDCAYLPDLGIVITQDSLVEDVHFSFKFSTPFDLGYKSVAVNISDIYASGAEPKYLTVSLSLPKKLDENFVKEFYEGVNSACNTSIKVIGGDITGSDKVFVSVCAIGTTKKTNISSRKNAKVGYKVIITGESGSSSAGLYLLQNGLKSPKNFIQEHLRPTVIPLNIITTEPYAMMDTSDGLMDALFKIAEASNITLDIDFNKIPYDKKIENIKNFDWKRAIFFGGEDYKLLAAVPESALKNLKNYYLIGDVIKKSNLGFVKINNQYFNENDIKNNCFNHFE